MSAARKSKSSLSLVTPPDPARLPPQNLEAEAGVLGGLLRKFDMDAVRPVLRVEDFYVDRHQIIYREILAMADEEVPIDPLVLCERLRTIGQFERIGGDKAILDLMDENFITSNTICYAEIVREKARLRDLIDTYGAALEAAYAAERPADELVAQAIQNLEAVRQAIGCSTGGFATLADAAKAVGDIRWRWEQWIPAGVLSLLVAKGGTGKSRLAMWLARLFWYGLPMPDGSPNPFPAGTPTLWVLVDRNWQGTAALAKSFGVPLEAVHLNTPRDSPLSLPELDNPRTIAALRSQILDLNPALVIVDTITYATARNTAKADEAKAAYDALMSLAAETGAAILGLTHTNADGSTLNRRIEERARSAIYLLEPDPESQRGRLRLWVEKAEVEKPPALGVTHHDDRLEFDNAPPTRLPAGGHRGPAPVKSKQFAEWLWGQLGTGPVAIAQLVELARVDGFLASPTAQNSKPSISPLYAARDKIPTLYPGREVEEINVEDNRGRMRRHWGIAQKSADSELDPEF